MVRVVQLPPLPRAVVPGDRLLVEFGLGRPEVARMWRMVLAMAVRDGAVSVHWHPWRAADALGYVVAGVRYSLARPPAALDGLVSGVARELVAPGRVRSAVGRWLGLSAAGRFRCESEYGPSEWCGAWWGTGGVCGAELHRLDIAITPITESKAEPSTATDPAAFVASAT